jgi:hypothetical protein
MRWTWTPWSRRRERIRKSALPIWRNAHSGACPWRGTALYSRRHDTTVPARTEPRDTACGSPPFGSRSLAHDGGSWLGWRAVARRREPPPPAPPPLRRGGVTPPTARRGPSAFAARAALQSAQADFAPSLQRLQSPTTGAIPTVSLDPACGSPLLGSRSLARPPRRTQPWAECTPPPLWGRGRGWGEPRRRAGVWALDPSPVFLRVAARPHGSPHRVRT